MKQAVSRIACMLLALCMIASLAGCRQADGPAVESEPGEVQQETIPPASEPTEETILPASEPKQETVLPASEPQTTQDEGESYSVQGTVFTYKNHSYDLTEQHAGINAIMDVRSAGDYLVIDGHVGPKNGAYCIFDTKTETFVNSVSGANLVWYDDDLSTAIYSFWSDILDLDGNVLIQCDLAEQEFIYDLAYAEDGQSILVQIVSNDGADRTETYALADIEKPGN